MNPATAERRILDYTQFKLETTKGGYKTTSGVVPDKGKWALLRVWGFYKKVVAADVGMDELTTVSDGNLPVITILNREIVLFPHQIQYSLATEGQDATAEALCTFVTDPWLFLPVYHTRSVKLRVPFSVDDCLFYAEFGRYE